MEEENRHSKMTNRVSILCILLSLPFLVICEDNLIIPQAPDSIKFNSIEDLKSQDVANIFSAMFAFTVSQDVKWQSLAPVDPLKRPEAIFVYHIIGLTNNMDFNINGPTFPLENYGTLNEQYDILADRINLRYQKNPVGKPVLLKINGADDLYAERSEQFTLLESLPADKDQRLLLALKDPELVQVLKDKTFNTSIEEDTEFLLELGTVQLLLQAIKKNKDNLKDDVPDVFWVELRSLHSIVQRHGSDSFQAKEATRLIEQMISETVTTMNDVYDKNALVAVFTETPLINLSRKTRNILAADDPKPSNKNLLNLAFNFGANSSVAFALIAFTSIIFILAIFGISVAMWFIDPGRDSIIYRMTSQRMKKD